MKIAGILVIIFMFFFVGAVAIPTVIVQGYTHYHGQKELTTLEQVNSLESLIGENASNGGLNFLSPDYKVMILADGSETINYDFYSKNNSLPLDHYQK